MRPLLLLGDSNVRVSLGPRYTPSASKIFRLSLGENDASESAAFVTPTVAAVGSPASHGAKIPNPFPARKKTERLYLCPRLTVG
jgi:hypothetical protein